MGLGLVVTLSDGGLGIVCTAGDVLLADHVEVTVPNARPARWDGLELVSLDAVQDLAVFRFPDGLPAGTVRPLELADPVATGAFRVLLRADGPLEVGDTGVLKRISGEAALLDRGGTLVAFERANTAPAAALKALLTAKGSALTAADAVALFALLLGPSPTTALSAELRTRVLAPIGVAADCADPDAWRCYRRAASKAQVSGWLTEVVGCPAPKITVRAVENAIASVTVTCTSVRSVAWPLVWESGAWRLSAPGVIDDPVPPFGPLVSNAEWRAWPDHDKQGYRGGSCLPCSPVAGAPAQNVGALDAPVTCVSYIGASAYAKYRGKRLVERSELARLRSSGLGDVGLYWELIGPPDSDGTLRFLKSQRCADYEEGDAYHQEDVAAGFSFRLAENPAPMP